MTEHIFRPIPGFPGYRVWGVERAFRHARKANGRWVRVKAEVRT